MRTYFAALLWVVTWGAFASDVAVEERVADERELPQLEAKAHNPCELVFETSGNTVTVLSQGRKIASLRSDDEGLLVSVELLGTTHAIGYSGEGRGRRATHYTLPSGETKVIPRSFAAIANPERIPQLTMNDAIARICKQLAMGRSKIADDELAYLPYTDPLLWEDQLYPQMVAAMWPITVDQDVWFGLRPRTPECEAFYQFCISNCDDLEWANNLMCGVAAGTWAWAPYAAIAVAAGCLAGSRSVRNRCYENCNVGLRC